MKPFSLLILNQCEIRKSQKRVISVKHIVQCKDRLCGTIYLFFITAALFAITIQAIPASGAQGDFEQPPVLDITTILPSKNLNDPLYTVDSLVLNNGYVNTYQVKSRFGNFTVASTPSLRILLHEIRVIAAMRQVERDDVFVDSLQQSAKNTAQGIKRLFLEPGETFKGAGEGFKGLFARAEESLAKSDPSDAEDSRVAQILGYSKAKGEIANQFTVNVYTDNAVLEEELDSLAWANYLGGLGMAAVQAAVPGGAGLILSTSSAVRLLNETVNLTPATELRVQNRRKLESMEVDEDLIQLFINNPAFSPHNQTFFVSALENLNRADNRELFVKVALQLHDQHTIRIVTKMTIMFAAYHKNIGAIKRFSTFSRFAAAEMESGQLLLMLPADHLTWNREFAGAIESLAIRAGKQQPDKGQLWILGSVSKRTNEELSKRGWSVKTDVAEVLKIDQP